jgi:hypothetical protein
MEGWLERLSEQTGWLILLEIIFLSSCFYPPRIASLAPLPSMLGRGNFNDKI